MNLCLFLVLLCCPSVWLVPVVHDERPNENEFGKDTDSAVNDLGLEYGRYLQEVVAALEEDKEFAKKLENVSSDHIKSGAIASELNFVSHNIRTKLDELKRIEIERLRKLTKLEHEYKEFGADSRQWRTLGSGGPDKTNKQMNQFEHLDHKNPHSFEVQDLHNLIIKATRDLEALDKKRREEFKNYEMEKEHQYREGLKNMTEDQRKEAVKKHDEMVQKHKEHPRVHHPGSKQQLEEVWEEQDHMPKEEFNPKTFFALHDVNGDGYLDQEEVEALLSLEIKKMYDPNNPEDDPNEMEEEYHRMREHVYKEADKNKDGLISQMEFIELTQKAEFEKDDGWKGIDEQQLFNENELQQYEAHRQERLAQQYGYYMPPYQPYGHPGGHPQQPPPQHFGNVPPYQVAQHQQGYPPQQQQQNVYQAQPQFGVHQNQHPNQFQQQGYPNNQQHQQQMPPQQQHYQYQPPPPPPNYPPSQQQQQQQQHLAAPQHLQQQPSQQNYQQMNQQPHQVPPHQVNVPISSGQVGSQQIHSSNPNLGNPNQPNLNSVPQQQQQQQNPSSFNNPPPPPPPPQQQQNQQPIHRS